MTLSPLDELRFLTEALTAHVAWAQSTGGYGLPACDETWLQARREHYRRTPYVGDDVNAEVSALELSSASEGARTIATAPDERAQVSAPVLDPAPNAEIHPLRVAEPAVEAPSAPRPRPSVPSPVGFEVAALVDKSASPANDAPPRGTPPAEARVPAAPLTRPAPAVTLESPGPSLASLSVEERRTRLTVLEDQVKQCRDCGLCEERTNTVFARGNGSSGVAFVGEGPGADEDAQGYPFVGAAGQLLDKMIAAMGLERDSVYVCNIVKCRPPKNRKPTEEEMATCRHYVVSQLELVQPRVIVALGATAVEGLLGLKLGITRLRGTWRLYKGSVPVMPTFHPAYLLRQPDAKRDVWEDLQAVLTRINMPLPQRRK